METNLSFRTKSVYVCIDNYEKYSFNYQCWTISDDYVTNDRSPLHSRYSICITSPSITNQDELADYSLQGQKIADVITELIPIAGLPSLNSPKFKSFSSNLALEDYKSAPYGWSSNYATIISSLFSESGNKCNLNVSIEGFVYHTTLDQSPLNEIQHMLEHYDEAEDSIKFLLFLNNSILSANDINVFMLIGKALEIIFEIGVYSTPQWDKRKPIRNYFPELSEVLQDKTFGNLFDWTNHRKESRHYVNDKCRTNVEAHISLTGEERKYLYICTNCLSINVIRDAFGLSRLSVSTQLGHK